MRTIALAILCFLFCTAPLTALATDHTASSPCRHDPAYGKLDFWVGRWNVYTTGGALDGSDVVEKIMEDCAIVEIWREADGSGKGESIFYYVAAKKLWKQVWITDAGQTKEKQLIREFPDGGLRFQGEIPHADGTSHLDRTTLTPVPGDKVHQVIEISTDGGKDWQVVYDAEYRRQH